MWASVLNSNSIWIYIIYSLYFTSSYYQMKHKLEKTSHKAVHRLDSSLHQGDAQWRAGPTYFASEGPETGDPLSPQLFVLVINTINKLLAKATVLEILRKFARRDMVTTVSLYADDVVIFCHPDETELRAIRSILALFRHVSGLHTNFAKCSVSPIACSEEVALTAATVMECQLEPFPVKYLGIPLGIRRLPSEAFQPLVDRWSDQCSQRFPTPAHGSKSQ